ncbi:YetF domain-containing protein [Dyadobacter sp. 676]|uniref:YetF domain-containing protein n=1 Tax=Dyadobacter sp. 676 TaxID=3088362 RepID=A0AAU8FJ93_9BACT
MKKEDIIPGDWYRILFGETPVAFLAEIFLRTIIMYVVLLVTVRMMGKRMGGQLTISELAVMITLGAIVSPGMQMPQTGLLLCTLILLCALLFQRGLNLLEYKSERFEHISQGKLSTLVKDGIMQLDEMHVTKVSRQQLFAALRNRQIYNLGDVDRVYLEACGLFSVYRHATPRAGLPLFPPHDPDIAGFGQAPTGHTLVCANCGKVAEGPDSNRPCPVCDATQWGEATISNSNQPASTAL